MSRRVRKKGTGRLKVPQGVIGWREWVRFPELGDFTVKAKVDTGARTSALHADDLEFFDRRGERWVRFTVHPEQRTNAVEFRCQAHVIEDRIVKSSNGEITHRPVVETTIAVGEACWPIELTLINRDEMGFRMLLGRTAIKNKFLVDVGHSYLLSREYDRVRRKARKKKASKKSGRKKVRS